jgi:hypothetical protein
MMQFPVNFFGDTPSPNKPKKKKNNNNNDKIIP